MAEVTREALAALEERIAALEQKLAEESSPQARLIAFLKSPRPCEDIELVRQVHAEIEAAREVEREAARRGDADEPHIVG